MCCKVVYCSVTVLNERSNMEKKRTWKVHINESTLYIMYVICKSNLFLHRKKNDKHGSNLHHFRSLLFAKWSGLKCICLMIYIILLYSWFEHWTVYRVFAWFFITGALGFSTYCVTLFIYTILFITKKFSSPPGSYEFTRTRGFYYDILFIIIISIKSNSGCPTRISRFTQAGVSS